MPLCQPILDTSDPLPVAAGPARPDRPRPRSRPLDGTSLAISCALHLMLVLLIAAIVPGRAPPPGHTMRAVLITLPEAPAVEQPGELASSEPPVPAAPATDTEPVPKQTARPTSRPTPVPEPRTSPRPTQPPAPVREPGTAVEGPHAEQPDARPTESESSPVEEQRWALLLSRVRTNWLRPPGSPSTFHCRLQIEYRDDVVTGVALGEGCDDGALGHSIVRAVWKTRTLSLEQGSPPAGRLELEFTP